MIDEPGEESADDGPIVGELLEVVTVIADNLCRPLGALLDVVESRQPVPPNDFKSNAHETGNSAAIVLLVAAILEAVAHRASPPYQPAPRSCKRAVRLLLRGRKNDSLRSALKEWRTLLKSEKSLWLDLEEVFVLRDVVVHAHLWLATLALHDETIRVVEGPRLEGGFGNRRLRAIMVPGKQQSKRLGLNLFPTRIWRRDAYVAIRTMLKALAAVEDRTHIVHTFQFPWRGQQLRVREFAALVCDAVNAL